ncbi:MAG: hypothetical protein RBU24_00815 [Kiritimatiellia bacterium]|nr:hypothetical protein [Kiritimatiellia bacterium]
MVTVESTGERYTLSELARRAGMTAQAIQYRWRRAGRPSVIDAAMLRPVSQGKHGEAKGPNGAIIVDYPPHGRVTFRQIQEIHAHANKSMQFFMDRWRRAGRPRVVSAELFAHPDMRRIKDRADPKYLDDSLWSKDVPFADLCHLSGTENTGAGKGSIPDEEWARMGSSVRSIMAGLYRRVPFAGTGGD